MHFSDEELLSLLESYGWDNQLLDNNLYSKKWHFKIIGFVQVLHFDDLRTSENPVQMLERYENKAENEFAKYTSRNMEFE